MRRRRFHHSLVAMPLLALAVLVASGCSRGGDEAAATDPSASRAPARPPTVLFIISDDQAWGDYSFMGHEVIRTPNIDRLASESLVYTRGYVPASTCRPSLASILTGLYPHQHLITGNAPAGEENHPETQRPWVEHLRTLPRLPALLSGAGWVTMQTGKWWEGRYTNGGFDIGLAEHEAGKGYRFGDVTGLELGREHMGVFLEHLAAFRDRPYFLWFAPMLPHHPLDAPERLVEPYRAPGRSELVSRYYANVAWFDEAVGNVLDDLDESGLAKDTIVVFLADNGWIQLPDSEEWGIWGRAKLSPYDAGVRTPIMIRWPGHVDPRRDDTHLASSVDLVPTVLGALGLPVPEELPGIDLLDEGAVAARDAVFGSIHARQAPDPMDPLSSLKWRWVVEGRHKLIDPYPPNRDLLLKSYHVAGEVVTLPNERMPWITNRTELYDVVADPGETRDLAAERPELVRELRARLDAWWPVPRTEG